MAFWSNLWYQATHYWPRRALRATRWRKLGLSYKTYRARMKLINFRKNLSGSTRITPRRAKKWTRRRLYFRSSSTIPKSPVPKSLVRSNGAPADEQVPSIHAHIATVKALQERTIAPRDTSSASRHTAREKAFKEVLERQLNEHRALVSPFRKLPLEILQEIICYLLPCTIVEVSPGGHSRLRHFSIPVLHSHVSQKFRVAAQTMPALWTHLPRININHPTTRTRPYLSWLRRVLSLSGSLPIHIRVGLQEKKATDKMASHPAFDILKEHAHRWSSATLHLPPILMSDLGRDGRAFPILSELEIDGFRKRKWKRRQPPLGSIVVADIPSLNAPSLKAITFSGNIVWYSHGGSSVLPLLQWWEKGNSNTNALRNLRSLRLSIDNFNTNDMTGPSATETLTLPSVEVLDVRTASRPRGRPSFVDKLRLPALKHVTIESDLFSRIEGQMECLFLLLDRSGTLRSLESLKVVSYPYIFRRHPPEGGWRGAALMRILTANECLESLELDMLNYGTFVAASVPHSGRALLPSLKTLVLGQFEDFDPTPVNTFVGYLTDNGTNAPGLEMVELKLVPDTHPGGLTWWRGPDVTRPHRARLEGWDSSDLSHQEVDYTTPVRFDLLEFQRLGGAYSENWARIQNQPSTLYAWLERLEAIEVEPRKFMISGLYHSVSNTCFSLMVESRSSLGDQAASDVLTKARALLAKWRPVLAAYCRENVQWFLVRDSNRLRFIPRISEIRLTASDSEMVDGFEN